MDAVLPATEAVADIGRCLGDRGRFRGVRYPGRTDRRDSRRQRHGFCGVLEQLLCRRLRARNPAVRFRRVTAPYVGENKNFARQYPAGELEEESTRETTPRVRIADVQAVTGTDLVVDLTVT